jgi:deoxyhypusine synthase
MKETLKMYDIQQSASEKDLLLSRPVKHIDMTQFDARPIIQSMRDMSFTARDLANAADIFNKMIKDERCSIILTLFDRANTQKTGIFS